MMGNIIVFANSRVKLFFVQPIFTIHPIYTIFNLINISRFNGYFGKTTRTAPERVRSHYRRIYGTTTVIEQVDIQAIRYIPHCHIKRYPNYYSYYDSYKIKKISIKLYCLKSMIFVQQHF